MTEQEAQAIVDQRGYLVVSTYDDLAIGSMTVANWSNNPDIDDVRDHKLVIIAKTNRADHREQIKLLGIPEKCAAVVPNYYRVIAE